MKKLDIEKKEVMHINDSHMTCEECGDYRHSATSCPTLQEDVNFINNIKDGINNLDKVITKVTTKVIILITIFHL